MIERTQKAMLSAWGFFQRYSHHLLFLPRHTLLWGNGLVLIWLHRIGFSELLGWVTDSAYISPKHREKDCASPCYHHESFWCAPNTSNFPNAVKRKQPTGPSVQRHSSPHQVSGQDGRLSKYIINWNLVRGFHGGSPMEVGSGSRWGNFGPWEPTSN